MINTEINFNDYLIYNNYVRQKNKNWLQKYAIWIVVIYITFGIFKSSSYDLKATRTWVNIAVMLGFLFLFLYIEKRIVKKYALDFVKKNPNILSKFQIEFNDECVIVTTSKSKSEYNYSAFVTIDETEKYYYVFLSTASAIIISKENSSQLDEIERLVQKIKSKL